MRLSLFHFSPVSDANVFPTADFGYRSGLQRRKISPTMFGQPDQTNVLPFEIICVNDGSTDGCNEILSRYAAKDRRIRLICQNNRGLSAARNAGLKKAKGQYVLFVDSDDFLHPEALSSLL